jgi:hypothetical protein
MAVVAVFQGPTVTQAKYEESVRRLTGGKTRMGRASDWPVKGLLVHIAGQSPKGFRIVDVWESDESFKSFGEKLVPILKALGMEGDPEVYQAHTVVTS